MSKTLLFPLISTGNVPQLTIDLILHSLAPEFTFQKHLNDDYLYPFLGPLDYSNENDTSIYSIDHDDNTAGNHGKMAKKTFSNAIELFANKDKSVYIIQQRTPIINDYVNNFIVEVLIPLVKEYNFTNITILDSFSSFDYSKPFIHENRTLTTTTTTTTKTNTNISIGICQLESVSQLTKDFNASLNLYTDPETSIQYTKSLFKFNDNDIIHEISTSQTIFKITYHLLNDINLNSLQQIKYMNFFVHEGDNSMDAKMYCQYLNEMLCHDNENIKNYTIKTFKTPISWKGVYGLNEAPSTIEDGIYI